MSEENKQENEIDKTLVKNLSDELMMSVVIQKVLTLMAKDFPLLSASFIRPILVLIVNFVAKYYFRIVKLETQLFLDAQKVSKELEDFKNSFEELKTNVKEGDIHEFKTKFEDAKKKLSNLVSYHVK